MKKFYLKASLLVAIILSGSFQYLQAQCPTITCPSNIIVNNDSGICGAVVNFTPPVGINPCYVPQIFSYTGTIQTWTVPAGVTSITIEAKGAQGGYSSSSPISSGLGASMKGDFTVVPGSVLKILVGQQPSTGGGNGGGGGSFVTDISNNPLIVAGGGGGSSSTTDSPDKNGQITTTGGTGTAGGGTGGTAGNGGSVGGSGFQAGAGGGLLTNGADGWTSSTGGFAFINGGAGAPANVPANGGFGGGGSGSSYVVGGGGGGYSGGGSGGNSTGGVGGGGGSFNAGINQTNAAGVQTGNGLVTITYIPSIATDTFNYTGAMQSWTVPAGITSITIDAYGAQGGADDITPGGFGGSASGQLAVTAGTTLNIFVGGKGVDGPVGQDCNFVGGWNGGGNTGSVCCSNSGSGAGSGGGASDIRIGGTALTDRIIVAAGGGGSGSNDPGAAGGGLTGSDGGSYSGVTATGGSQIAGGQGGGYYTGHTCSQSTDGVFGIGGMGDGNDGGGAGGGWYGGGGGSNNGGGAGGSSYITGVTSGTTTGGVHAGNGQILITHVQVLTTTQTAGLPSGSTFPVGTTTQTFKVTDQLLDTASCSFTITVNDNEAPTFTCPSNLTACHGEALSIAPTAVSDNCGAVTVTYALTGATTGSGVNDASSVSFNTGVTTVKYVFNDGNGNLDSCSFDVTINSVDTSVTLTQATLTATGTGTYQWYNCGTSSNIVGATSASYTATANGSYAVIITDGSCIDTSSCHTITVVGLLDNNSVSNIQVYPNPSNGQVNVDLPEGIAPLTISVYDLDGKQVYSMEKVTAKHTVMNLKQMSPGVYFIKLNNDQTQQVVKLIKL